MARFRLPARPRGVPRRHPRRPVRRSARVAYVNGIYREIENHWQGQGGDSTRFARDLRTYGGMLYSQLFPEKLQAQLWEKRNQITSIQVISTEPFIPWELVYIKKPGQGVSAQSKFLGQMGLVRGRSKPPARPASSACGAAAPAT